MEASEFILQMDNPDSEDWTTLSTHKDDTTLTGSHAIASWDLQSKPTDEGFRFFRVIQTGPNSWDSKKGTSDEWSNVLAVCGFELYGELIRLEVPKITVNINEPSTRLVSNLMN